MYRFLVTLWNNIPYTYYITTIIHKETTTIRMKPVLKKTLKIVAALVAIPIVIVVLLAVLLYVPPVQNWAVDQVANYVSSSTRMTVNVDRVRLRFPLDLAVYGLRATQPNDSLYNVTDTIVDARQLNVSVRLMPLLKSNVVVDQLDFNDVRLNTAQFVPSARVKGNVGRLLLHSRHKPCQGDGKRRQCLACRCPSRRGA